MKLNNYFPMSINKVKNTVVFTNHVFDYRNSDKRIGNLTKEKVRELIRASIEKGKLLAKRNYRYVITYPRENDCFSAILVSKEEKNWVVVTIVHSQVKYQRAGLLPREKNSIDFSEEETMKIFSLNEPKKIVKKQPLIRKIKKVQVVA